MALVESRCAAARRHLAEALARPFDPPRLEEPARRRYLTTGVGLSEGPARVLAALLQGAGLCAAFRPLSSFAVQPPPGAWDTLVVFSQGLSPGACMALRRRRAFRDTLLVTGLGPAPLADELEREGAWVHRHAPAEEEGILLRIIGPALASLCALRLADHLGRLASAPGLPDLGGPAAEALETAPARAAAVAGDDLPERLEGPLALVTCGDYGALCHGLRWKLLEGLWLREPHHWDVLQVAHGPFQQFVPGPMTLVALERPEPGEAALLDRLAQVLEPPRHRLVRLRSALRGPAALLDHDAQLNAVLQSALRARVRDLSRWPGQGRDAPLYRFTGEG